MMLKKILLTIILCLLPLSVSAENFTDAVPDFSMELLKEFTGNATFSGLIESVIKGENVVNEGILEKIVSLVIGDIRHCGKYIISVMGFSILSSCIKGSQIRLSDSASEIAFLICYFVVAAFLVGILRSCVDIAVGCADEMEVFVRMSLPAYIGVISASGIEVSASQGIFLAMINIVSGYVGGFMIDAFFYIGILTVISNMSSGLQMNKLIHISRQVLFWTLGFLLTVFAGMTALSGLNAAASSALGMRAVKYTIGHAIPVVGGFLADSAELILASAKIFRNAFGTVGIIILAIVCLVPVVKLFAVGFMLRITAGLTEPFCDKLICDTVYGVGQTIIHIMVAMLLMTVMFILAFAVLMSI